MDYHRSCSLEHLDDRKAFHPSLRYNTRYKWCINGGVWRVLLGRLWIIIYIIYHIHQHPSTACCWGWPCFWFRAGACPRSSECNFRIRTSKNHHNFKVRTGLVPAYVETGEKIFSMSAERAKSPWLYAYTLEIHLAEHPHINACIFHLNFVFVWQHHCLASRSSLESGPSLRLTYCATLINTSCYFGCSHPVHSSRRSYTINHGIFVDLQLSHPPVELNPIHRKKIPAFTANFVRINFHCIVMRLAFH
jgi:hypothetical protein